MDTQIQVFENTDFGKVRVVEIGGQPWFIGMDVAYALGYSNTKKALADHVDAEDKLIIQRSQFVTLEIPNRGITAINESGLYSLILSSKLPNARVFKRWITTDVLPSIRKHGAYIAEATLNKMINSSEFASELVNRLLDEKEKTATLIEYVEELHPKARYCDIVLRSADVVHISIIAKDYGMSAVTFNQLLRDLRIQYKCNKTWILYQPLAGKGYTASRTYCTPSGESVIHTLWTQKGRRFLYETLKKNGIFPLVEIMNAI